MGLGTVLGNALSGMRVTQTGLDVVSQNVSNAGSIGYVARQVSNVERVENGSVAGARTAQVQRVLDRLVQRQLWNESAGSGYTDTRAQSLQAVDQLFGRPMARARSTRCSTASPRRSSSSRANPRTMPRAALCLMRRTSLPRGSTGSRKVSRICAARPRPPSTARW